MSEDNIYGCECGRMFVTEQGLRVHEHSCSEVEVESPSDNSRHKVTEEMCMDFRNNVLDGLTVNGIANVSTVSETIVGYHVRGECTHNHGVPSLEYDHSESEWVESE